MPARSNKENLQWKNGFSALELLVITVILTSLASLLLPAIQTARMTAQQVTCVNNLKQIGLAVSLYTQDYNEMTPGVVPGLSEGVYILLNAYINDPEVFWCPTSGESHKWNGTGNPGYGNNVSYGFNNYGTGNGTPHGKWSGFCTWISGTSGYKYLQEIRNPPELIVATDSYPDFIQDFVSSYYLGAYWPGYPHKGGSNVLWADYHVSWKTYNELINTLRYWNDDNTDNDY